LIQNDAQGEQVRSVISRGASGLFRTHVRDCAHDNTGLGERNMRLLGFACVRVRPRDFGQSEVEHFDVATGRDHEIGGCYIPMDHPARVSTLQGVCDLAADVDDLPCRHWLTGATRRQRVAIDVLHRNEADVIAVPDVINDRHVRMGEG
jgi:hypothetical protein